MDGASGASRDEGGAAGGGGPDDAWFRRWFGPEYLALYPHRDREEAERGVRLFLEQTGTETGARALDLGCGSGRHLAAFGDRGIDVFGLDLSRPLLERAREATGGAVPLVQADMRRVPMASESFDAVTSFFTSFGYFASRAEDRRVLSEIRRVLRPGGAYLLDFLNARQVRSDLVPEEESTVDGKTVVQTREIREGHVVKRIEIRPEGAREPPKVYHERVRLYEPEELMEMLDAEELPVKMRFGDYDGSRHDATSPRFIALGRAE